MHLVPCRWSKNGWRYVEKDPHTQGFFNSPNKINSVGYSPLIAKYAHKLPKATDAYLDMPVNYENPKNSLTTYGSFFNTAR